MTGLKSQPMLKTQPGTWVCLRAKTCVLSPLYFLDSTCRRISTTPFPPELPHPTLPCVETQQGNGEWKEPKPPLLCGRPLLSLSCAHPAFVLIVRPSTRLPSPVLRIHCEQAKCPFRFPGHKAIVLGSAAPHF